ncbi:MAG TPA: response regulator transcription factor [Anaerolineae bacterium]|nr:response regulator transcription factor [Anaerolineae bacterium]
MGKIRVLLAEDHTIVRKGLRALLDDETDIEVVGEAEDGRETVRQVERVHPDVVLMDITMPLLNGVEATRQIKAQYPEVQVLGLTRHENEEYIYQLLRAGASGYVVKQAAPAELVEAIRAVFEGDTFLSPSINPSMVEEYIRQAKAMVKKGPDERLTPREREVLQLVAEGRTNREIAQVLSISVKTVEHHRANLMSKLELYSAAELTQYAIRVGVIDVDQGL